jgi:hypothetical protein
VGKFCAIHAALFAFGRYFDLFGSQADGSKRQYQQNCYPEFIHTVMILLSGYFFAFAGYFTFTISFLHAHLPGF